MAITITERSFMKHVKELMLAFLSSLPLAALVFMFLDLIAK